MDLGFAARGAAHGFPWHFYIGTLPKYFIVKGLYCVVLDCHDPGSHSQQVLAVQFVGAVGKGVSDVALCSSVLRRDAWRAGFQSGRGKTGVPQRLLLSSQLTDISSEHIGNPCWHSSGARLAGSFETSYLQPSCKT